MSIASTTNRVTYAGNDSATVFSFPYLFLAQGDLTVIITSSLGVETVQTITTHYTVSGAGVSAGGSVTMLTAPATGETLTILNNPDATQPVDLVDNDSLPAETVEQALDRLTILVQRLQSQVSRKVGVTDGFVDTFDLDLPSDLATANAVLVVNAAGDGWDVGPTTTEIADAEANATAAAASASAAAASAAAAATSAAASQWKDVVYVTNADSPVSIVDGDTGKLYSVDTSSGAVVFNLPAISSLSLSSVWAIGIKKQAGSNNITVNRNGTDTIDGATSVTISRLESGRNFIPDADASPDEWTTMEFGEVPISGAIVGTTDTQDLSNKTFTDAITLEELASAPSNPSSGDKKFYAKNDGKLYTLDSGGNEIEVGSGASSGELNYFDGGDFESGVGLATTFNDPSAYTDGDGGTVAALSVAQNATTPLSGTSDLGITKAASDASEDGVTLLSETINRADVGRSLIVEFEWDGTDANYTDGDYALYAYDVTGTAILPVLPINGLNDDGSLPARKTKVTAEVLTTSSTTGAVRVSLYMASDSDTGNAHTCYVDRATLKTEKPIPGAIVSEWESFTPSGTFVSNTTYTGQKRRVGDTLECRIRLEFSGAPTTATLDITLPDGLTADTTKAIEASALNICGHAHLIDAAPSKAYNGGVRLNTTTQVRVTFMDDPDTSNHDVANVTESFPITLASGDELYIFFSVPISGWASSALVSTTEIAFTNAAVKSSATPTGTLGSAWNKATFGSTEYDNLDSYDTSGGQFTAPKTGFYFCAAYLAIEKGNQASGTLVTTGVRVINTTLGQAIYGGEVEYQSSGVGLTIDGYSNCSGILYANKGDIIEIQSYVTGGSPTWTADFTGNGFSIHYLPELSAYSIYGETDVIEAETSTATNFPAAAGNYADLESITLTPGEWDIEARVMFYSNGATTTTSIYAGFGTTSGNNPPGSNNDVSITTKNTTTDSYDTLNNNRKGVVVTTPTTYYLKGRADTSVTNLQYVSKIQARRIK